MRTKRTCGVFIGLKALFKFSLIWIILINVEFLSPFLQSIFFYIIIIFSSLLILVCLSNIPYPHFLFSRFYHTIPKKMEQKFEIFFKTIKTSYQCLFCFCCLVDVNAILNNATLLSSVLVVLHFYFVKELLLKKDISRKQQQKEVSSISF